MRNRVRVRVRLFSPLRHLHCAEYRKPLCVMLRYEAGGTEDHTRRHRGVSMTNQAYRHDYEQSPTQEAYRPDLVPDTKPQLDYSPSDRSVSLSQFITNNYNNNINNYTHSTFIDQT